MRPVFPDRSSQGMQDHPGARQRPLCLRRVHQSSVRGYGARRHEQAPLSRQGNEG